MENGSSDCSLLSCTIIKIEAQRIIAMFHTHNGCAHFIKFYNSHNYLSCKILVKETNLPGLIMPLTSLMMLILASRVFEPASSVMSCHKESQMNINNRGQSPWLKHLARDCLNFICTLSCITIRFLLQLRKSRKLIQLQTLTEIKPFREFHKVGRGLPWTTLHSASTPRFLYLTSTVGNFTPTL